MSHRLNLVVRAFESVDNIRNVLKFADWFSGRRKAVAYKKWLCEKYPNNHFKKIPKPSETRWCFYKEVIAALLTQVKEVDEFLASDEDFTSFGKMSWPPLGETSPSPTACFLKNAFIHSHFRFTLFILEKISLVNSKLQHQNMTLPIAWVLIKQLKEEFRNNLARLKDGDCRNFEYLRQFDRECNISFQTFVDSLLFNMEMRFPCPGISIGKRNAKRHVNAFTKQLNELFLRQVRLSCPFLEAIEIFIFPDELLRKQQINPTFLSRKYPEIQQIAREILFKRDIIEGNNMGRMDPTSERERQMTVITLLDVFKVIKKDSY